MAKIPDILPMKTTGKTAPKAEKGKPDPAKLMSGKYLTTTWNHWHGEDDRLFCGIWESTPGKVPVDYQEWEFCHIISGELVLRQQGSKKSWRFKRGDAFIIPAGFKGTWETVKKVRKHYVILMPKA
jgi:uncharacterized protein